MKRSKASEEREQATSTPAHNSNHRRAAGPRVSVGPAPFCPHPPSSPQLRSHPPLPTPPPPPPARLQVKVGRAERRLQQPPRSPPPRTSTTFLLPHRSTCVSAAREP